MATGLRSLTQFDKDLLRPHIKFNVDKTDDGHWLWLGKLDKEGYGLLFGQKVYRLAYMAWIGPIEVGCTSVCPLGK